MARQVFFDMTVSDGFEVASDLGWCDFADWVETLPAGSSACLREFIGECRCKNLSGLVREIQRHRPALADRPVTESIADALLEILRRRAGRAAEVSVWDNHNWVFGDGTPECDYFWDEKVKVSPVLAGDLVAAAGEVLAKFDGAAAEAAGRSLAAALSAFKHPCNDVRKVLDLAGTTWGKYSFDAAEEAVPLLEQSRVLIQEAWERTKRVRSFISRYEKRSRRKDQSAAAGPRQLGSLEWALGARIDAEEAEHWTASAGRAAAEGRFHRAAHCVRLGVFRAAGALVYASEAWYELSPDVSTACSPPEIARAMAELDEIWELLFKACSPGRLSAGHPRPAPPARTKGGPRRLKGAAPAAVPAADGRGESAFDTWIDFHDPLWDELGLDPGDNSRWTKHWKKVARVEKLRVDPETCNDRVMRAVGKLTRLRSLDLGFCSCVTPAGMAELSGLQALEVLNLANVYDEGSSDWPTEAHLDALPKLPKLRYLDLSFSGVLPDGLEFLKKFPNLRVLSLHGCFAATDESLRHLAGLHRLEALSIEACEDVTNDGLKYLAKLTSLRELVAFGTDTTAVGLARLRALLPGCVVDA